MEPRVPAPLLTPSRHLALEQKNGGQSASINRPIAGATHDRQLPVGRHPLQLYSLSAPVGVKGDSHVRRGAGARPERAE